MTTTGLYGAAYIAHELVVYSAAGEPLGHRRERPHNPDGWTAERDQVPPDQQGGGKRPPLRDNTTPKETPR